MARDATVLDPVPYEDTYREDVLAMVERKVKAGKSKEIAAPSKPRAAAKTGEVIDLMPLLKKSMEKGRRVASAETVRAAPKTVRRKKA